MRVFVELETEAKSRFLNHEDLRAWFLTDLEDGSPLSLIYRSMCKVIVVLI